MACLAGKSFILPVFACVQAVTIKESEFITFYSNLKMKEFVVAFCITSGSTP